MTKQITINLSYYNQPKHVLLKHIQNWKEFPVEIREKFTFFIIDDCSTKPANDLLSEEDKRGIDLHIYRVKEDLVCNIAGVRNLGATECKTDYMVILDMDTVISPVMAGSLVKLANNNKDNNTAFKFNRKGPKKNGCMHPAVCLIRKKDYWNVGGCEEDLVGHYGYTDPSFWHRSRNILKIQECKDIYLLYCPDGESDINRDKSHNQSVMKNKIKSNNWSTDFIRFNWEKVF